jgi:phosphatidate cytidylyltransferase
MSSAISAKWSDLGIRVASALVLVPVVLACDWAGGFWFHVFVAILGCAVAYEWVRIVFPKSAIQYGLHMAAVLFGVLIPEQYGAGAAVGSILLVAVVSGLLARFGDEPSSRWSYFGVCYAGFPVISMIVLRNDETFGVLALLWVFLTVWAADIMAYFAGRMIGGPKLAPSISPKKTWAGLGGAVFGSALASLIFAHFAGIQSGFFLALLGGALAVVEQGGDLFESSLKRFYGVKDSGRLIPGHGGVIDRVDGLIVVVVVAALIGFYRSNGADAARGLLLW